MTYFGPKRRHEGEPFHSSLYDLQPIWHPTYFDTADLAGSDEGKPRTELGSMACSYASQQATQDQPSSNSGINVDIGNVYDFGDFSKISELSPSHSTGSEEMSQTESQHFCKVCDEFFPSQKGRKLHEKSCITEYDCDMCGQHFQRENQEKSKSFKQRVSNHKIRCKINYSCANCGKGFSTRWEQKGMLKKKFAPFRTLFVINARKYSAQKGHSRFIKDIVMHG